MAQLTLGEVASRTHTFEAADVEAFANLTGDQNPIHLDPEAAARSQFGGCIVHGVLVTGLLSRLLGMQLPGPGSIYLGQKLRFKKAVLVGSPITARVEVRKLNPVRQIVTMATQVYDETGALCVDGEAMIKYSAETADQTAGTAEHDDTSRQLDTTSEA